MNLDDKQREVLREAMQKDQDQIRTLDEKLRAAQKELVHATLAEKYDEKAVREKAEAVSKIQTDITVLRAKAFSSVAPTLKPEQREQMENSPIAAAMLGGRFGGGMGGGPGMNRGAGGDPGAAGGAGGNRRRPPGAGQ
jgi:Spy/CpxP family protein refolding chaperone